MVSRLNKTQDSVLNLNLNAQCLNVPNAQCMAIQCTVRIGYMYKNIPVNNLLVARQS